MTWRVAEVKPWFVANDGKQRQFFRASIDEGEPTVLISIDGKLDCCEHWNDEDCACRRAVRDSELLNEIAAPVGVEV